MLVVNVLNRALFSTRFLSQNEFLRKAINTKSSFSPMFIYCATRLIFE